MSKEPVKTETAGWPEIIVEFAPAFSRIPGEFWFDCRFGSDVHITHEPDSSGFRAMWSCEGWLDRLSQEEFVTPRLEVVLRLLVALDGPKLAIIRVSTNQIAVRFDPAGLLGRREISRMRSLRNRVPEACHQAGLAVKRTSVNNWPHQSRRRLESVTI